MRGTLPKPTLVELNEYDINQRIIEALTSVCSHAILFSIVDESKNAIKISQELQLSLSTVYKSLSNLKKLTLVKIEKFEFSDYEIDVKVDTPYAFTTETYIYTIVLKADEKGNTRTIKKKGVATSILKKVDGDWKIIKTHTSSRNTK